MYHWLQVLRPVPLGAVVGSVRANDSDTGSENSRLTYYLHNGRLADVFDVRSRSGEIRTKVVLGHDRARRYLLEVIAADGGVPALSATATVCCKPSTWLFVGRCCYTAQDPAPGCL